MRRIIFASGIPVLLVVVVVAAQPPVPPAPPPTPPAEPLVPPGLPSGTPGEPMPPRPFPAADAPMTPVRPTEPGARAETPLSKFQPMIGLPQVTQYAVRGALLGSSWMLKGHQVNGRFLYAYSPALGQPMLGDNDLMQARAALAMAQSARFSGNQDEAVHASQAILTLLTLTKLAADQQCLVPITVSYVCNRVGFAALVALAIYEMPNAADKLTEDAERLCRFLRGQLRTDGSVHYTDGANDVPAQIDPAGLNEYPGLALHALSVSHRVRPADWKKDAVTRGVAHYADLFRAKPHPMLAATVTPAATELYVQTKLTQAATAAFEMNDWLCGLQIPNNDPRAPQWAGGFRPVANGQPTSDPPSAVETGLYVQSLACAYQLTRIIDDRAREGKYRSAVTGAVQFLCGLQFLEENTRHFEDRFRANTLFGGVHLSPTDGTLRIDATACAVTGLLRFLSSGAERNEQ